MDEIRYRWSGQVMDTIDYAAFIGRNPGSERTFVASGDLGQGITHGVVAGMLISRLILDGTSPWSDVYEPSRKPLRAARNYVSENLTAAANFFEKVSPGEISSTDELNRAKAVSCVRDCPRSRSAGTRREPSIPIPRAAPMSAA